MKSYSEILKGYGEAELVCAVDYHKRKLAYLVASLKRSEELALHLIDRLQDKGGLELTIEQRALVYSALDLYSVLVLDESALDQIKLVQEAVKGHKPKSPVNMDVIPVSKESAKIALVAMESLVKMQNAKLEELPAMWAAYQEIKKRVR